MWTGDRICFLNRVVVATRAFRTDAVALAGAMHRVRRRVRRVRSVPIVVVGLLFERPGGSGGWSMRALAPSRARHRFGPIPQKCAPVIRRPQHRTEPWATHFLQSTHRWTSPDIRSPPSPPGSRGRDSRVVRAASFSARLPLVAERSTVFTISPCRVRRAAMRIGRRARGGPIGSRSVTRRVRPENDHRSS